jgi:hypothetical protein
MEFSNTFEQEYDLLCSEVMVRRALTSSLLSLLLITTLLWGGCVSCEQYFMFGGAKDCCAPDGHCKPKVPGQKTPDRACNQIAFDHHRHADLSVCLPATVITQIIPVDFTPDHAARQLHASRPPAPSPPDLQVLHSTFLI